jgi:hypothetical protein
VTVCAYGILAEIFFARSSSQPGKRGRRTFLFRKLFLQAFDAFNAENRRATRRDGALLSV